MYQLASEETGFVIDAISLKSQNLAMKLKTYCINIKKVEAQEAMAPVLSWKDLKGRYLIFILFVDL